MKKMLIMFILFTLFIASCGLEGKKVLSYNIDNGFPILEKYKEIAELEMDTEYEFDGFIKRSITKYNMDVLYMHGFSAMILSNMMSENTIETALKIKNESGKEDIVKTLSNYNRLNVEHLTPVSERVDKDDPIQEWHSLVLSYLKFLNYDVMLSLQDEYGSVTGACADISSMNVALLRLLGISPEDISFVTIPKHAITSFSYKGNDYIIDNNYLFQHKGDNIYEDTMGILQGVDYNREENYNKVSGICNDAYYITGFTMEGQITKEAYDNFISRYNYKNRFKNEYEDGWHYYQLKLEKDEFPENIPYVKVNVDGERSSKEVSYDIMSQVYNLSKEIPKSQYTQAKYGFQTLLVKYPEFYIRENSKTQLIKDYSKKYTTTDKMIKFIREEIKDDSIFNESHRVMDPEQIIVTKRGGAKDKAMLLHALMSNNNMKSYILFTDKKSYVLFKENEWKIIDTTSMCYTNDIEGELSLFLSKDEVRYPLMGRIKLSRDAKSLLRDLDLLK